MWIPRSLVLVVCVIGVSSMYSLIVLVVVLKRVNVVLSMFGRSLLALRYLTVLLRSC
jgi:hypothetical protein